MDTHPSQLLDDALWRQVEPLLPSRPSRQRRYAGRAPTPDRHVLTGILLVVTSGIAWNRLPASRGFGSGTACWQRLAAWKAAGAWPAIQATILQGWRERGLDEQYEALENWPGARKHPSRSPAGARPRPIQLAIAFHGGVSEQAARFVQQAVGARLRARIDIVDAPGARDADSLQLYVGGAWLASSDVAGAQHLPTHDELVPIASILESPYVLAHAAQARFGNWADIAVAARRAPLTCSTPGIGTRAHVYMEQIRAATGLDLIAMPCHGGGEQLRALAAGTTDCGVLSLASALPLIRAGLLRASAVSSSRPLPALPGVPCMVDLGFPDLGAATWFALYARAETESSVCDRLGRVTDLALNTPAARDAIDALGATRASRSVPFLKQQLLMESFLAQRYMAPSRCPR